MPLIITLRRDIVSSPFRRQLQRLCSLPGGHSLYLCSGYIWEPRKGYSVLDDDLLDCIAKGLGNETITTIAGKLQRSGEIDWLVHYRNFVQKLSSAGVRVVPYVAPKRNWHAKIAIRFDSSDKPMAAIVGSSNLTGPAYREGEGNWNYECDVAIWRPDPLLNKHFIAENDSQETDPLERIIVQLDTGIKQPNEDYRLEALHKDVLREKEEFVLLDKYVG